MYLLCGRPTNKLGANAVNRTQIKLQGDARPSQKKDPDQVYIFQQNVFRRRDYISAVGNLPWNLRAALFMCLFSKAPVV